MTPKQWLRLAPLLIFLLLSIMFSMGLFTDSLKNSVASRIIGKPLPAVNLPMLSSDGRGAVFDARLWSKEVVLLNIFASWCEPCAVEHPLLMKLAQERKVKILGIAWKDTQEKINAYLIKNGNPYSAIGVDIVGNMTVPLGLTGVPETYLLNQSGTVVYNTKQPLNEDIIYNEILPLVETLNAESNAK